MFRKTRSPSHWQLSGSCLPMLCSDVIPFLRIKFLGSSSKPSTKQKWKFSTATVQSEMFQNLICSLRERQLKGWRAKCVLAMFERFRCTTGASKVNNRNKLKFQSKNYCKGSNWCRDILWSNPALNWKRDYKLFQFYKHLFFTTR